MHSNEQPHTHSLLTQDGGKGKKKKKGKKARRGKKGKKKGKAWDNEDDDEEAQQVVEDNTQIAGKEEGGQLKEGEGAKEGESATAAEGAEGGNKNDIFAWRSTMLNEPDAATLPPPSPSGEEGAAEVHPPTVPDEEAALDSEFVKEEETAGNNGNDPVIPKGTECLYFDKVTSNFVDVEVVKVDIDIYENYYTVVYIGEGEEKGRERQTTRAHLLLLDDNIEEEEEVEVQVEKEEDSQSEDEPTSWSCECCKKDFKSKGQWENHLKSKKHKEKKKGFSAK